MMEIPIEIIPRHVHLSQEDYEVLFGQDHVFKKKQIGSQKGQWMSFSDTIDLTMEKKTLHKLAVAGPWRHYSQVELSPQDAKELGFPLPLRRSGDISGSAKGILKGPKGSVSLRQGIIIPIPHLHCTPEDAKRLLVQNHLRVSVGFSHREEVLKQVVVRVHPTYQLALHVHTDFVKDYGLSAGCHAFLL